MAQSLLDPGQIIKTVFNSTTEAIKVTETSTSSDVISSYEIDYSSINGSAGAHYEVVASTASAVSQVLIYDTTGISMTLYTGGSGSETAKVIVGPGNDGILPCQIAASTRVTVKATGSSAPTAGKLYIVLIG
jgi:hypothetical protein